MSKASKVLQQAFEKARSMSTEEYSQFCDEVDQQEGVSMKKLDEINAKIKDLCAKECALREERDQLLEAIELPKLKKRFEGKYFKYKNSYSCPENPSDYWWMYTKCIEVKDRNTFNCMSFQTDSYGKVIIHLDESIPSCLGMQITKAEFDREMKKVLAKVKIN